MNNQKRILKIINICSTHSLTAKNGWSLRNSPTSCFVHTESNSHLSAITRCPYLRVYLIDYRHPELVSGSQYLTHYTIIENNYGQLRQMDPHRYSNNFLQFTTQRSILCSELFDNYVFLHNKYYPPIFNKILIKNSKTAIVNKCKYKFKIGANPVIIPNRIGQMTIEDCFINLLG